MVLSDDISKPVGAVAVISAERLVPEIVNFCNVETAPYVVVKADEVAVPVIVGEAGGVPTNLRFCNLNEVPEVNVLESLSFVVLVNVLFFN